jgi:outer membrane protein assembly factor BamA
MAETRLSCGLGLALAPAAFARLELNYGWVLRARPGDVAKGLQFGVSAAFGS